MAVGRQLNVKGQMRIDVPHLRLIESGVVYDFDTLAGGILAGKLPYVVTGFVPAAWTNGSPATSLSLVTADSIFVNYQASENGSMLMVPANRLPEALVVTNSRVTGSFAVSQTNYVSLDLTRTEDDTTSDVVHFIDPATLQGTPKIIPLGRTMDYQIHISSSPFSTSPQRCPVMKVVTDANNNIVSVTDARPMMFRLAAGGDSPSSLSKYAWPQGRTEAANSFVGGDKAIGDLKSWVSAIEEMIWQINAGEYWYSNTQMTSTWFMPGAVSEWTWDGTPGVETLTWSSPLEIVFTGSTAMHNTIAAGSIVLPANSALYVDFNRYTNGATLLPHVDLITTMGGEPTTPGIRYPIAWRVGSGTPAVRNFPVPVGASLVIGTATTTAGGTVRINTADATPYAVISDGVGGTAIANGIKRATAGVMGLGTTANETTVTIGGGVDNQTIDIGRSTATLGATSIYGSAINVGVSTSSINLVGTQVGLTSPYTGIDGGTLASNCGYIILGQSNTSTVSLGCFRPSDTNNTINIGNNHAGTGQSFIEIGKTTVGSTSIRGNAIHITSSGLVDMNINRFYVVTNEYSTNFNTIVVAAGMPGLVLDTNGPSASVSLICKNNGVEGVILDAWRGRVTVKTATVAGDPALTLATKGYVDGVGAMATAWTDFAALGGDWEQPTGGRHAQYCVVSTSSGNIVYVRGYLQAIGTVSPVALNLPVGTRPTSGGLLIPALLTIAAVRYQAFLSISTTGDIEAYYYPTYAGTQTVAPIGAALGFDGISWTTW
jgi:hypothetical protein